MCKKILKYTIHPRKTEQTGIIENRMGIRYKNKQFDEECRQCKIRRSKFKRVDSLKETPLTSLKLPSWIVKFSEL